MLRPGVSVLLSSLLLLGVPAAAQAASWQRADPAGDVTRYRIDPLPEPCGRLVEENRPTDREHDIVGVRMEHGHDEVRVVATYRDLARGEGHDSTFYLQTPERLWELEVMANRNGRTTVFFSKAPDYEAATESAVENECGLSLTTATGRTCRDLTAAVDPVRDTVEAVIPRSCLRDPRWVEVGYQTYAWSAAQPEWMIHDVWAPSGRDTDGFVPPLSPRVRRAVR